MLAVVSFGLRLFVPTYPTQVVYDEVHFGKHAQAYCCSHENYFDVHPPLGKILLSLPLIFSNYQGHQDFMQIGNEYDEMSPALFRFLPRFLGSLLPLGFFFLCLLLGISLWPSFAMAFAIAIDNGFIVQSRFALLDMFLLFFLVSALICYEISRRKMRESEWIWLVTAGIFAGASLAVKFSGAVALALICLSLFVTAFASQGGKIRQLLSALAKTLVLSLSAGFMYCLSWLFHFKLLTEAGSGNYFYTFTGNFWQDLVALHPLMFDQNTKLASHGDASPWWSWALMHKPVYYWKGDGGDIYFLGNPVLWLGALAAVALILVALLKKRKNKEKSKRDRKQSSTKIPWYGLIGAAGAFLPFALVPRPFFSYNFLMPLLFLLIFIGQGCDQLSMQWTRTRKTILISLLILGTVAILPVTYGFHTLDFWQTGPVNFFKW